MSDELKIVERTVAYSLRVIRLYKELRKDEVGRVLGRQLLRAGTSIGANVHEAQSAQSKADFIAKIYIAMKEARECLYWLRLIREAQVIRPKLLESLVDETAQIAKILTSILLTAKQRAKAAHS